MPNLMTAAELCELGEDRPGELIAGEFIPMSPAGGRHGKYAIQIGRIVGDYVEDHGLGEIFGAETGFIVSRTPDTVRAPDFAFIAKDRVLLIDEFDEFVSIPPDLAVEIVSPNDRWTKIEEKVRDFLRAGVRLVWVVNPKTKTIHVYQSFSEVSVLTMDDHLEGGEVLPGFRVAVARIFSEK